MIMRGILSCIDNKYIIILLPTNGFQPYNFSNPRAVINDQSSTDRWNGKCVLEFDSLLLLSFLVVNIILFKPTLVTNTLQKSKTSSEFSPNKFTNSV